jgi:hypothetical protein
VVRGVSAGGSRRPANGFRRNINVKIVPDMERMKNTTIHVCAKTAFVGWPSTESRRLSSFHNFMPVNNYFRKYFKSVYRENVVMVTLTTGIMLLLVTRMYIWMCEILRRWSSCAPISYVVVRDCRKFERQWVREWTQYRNNTLTV